MQFKQWLEMYFTYVYQGVARCTYVYQAVARAVICGYLLVPTHLTPRHWRHTLKESTANIHAGNRVLSDHCKVDSLPCSVDVSR